eukprot:gene4817-5885_t
MDSDTDYQPNNPWKRGTGAEAGEGATSRRSSSARQLLQQGGGPGGSPEDGKGGEEESEEGGPEDGKGGEEESEEGGPEDGKQGGGVGESVGDSVVVITEAATAEEQLIRALSNCSVIKVVLSTNIWLSKPPLTISHSVDIRGTCVGGAGRCVLDGQGGGPIMQVNSKISLDLRNVELRNGSKLDGGGLHILEGGIAHLRGCVIEQCTAINHGGGIYVESDATIVLDGTACVHNSAEKGGGVYVEKEGSLVLTRGSMMRENTASDGGGAVYCDSCKMINVDASTVSGNSAGIGGGIQTIACYDFTFVNGSKLVENHAAKDGGGASVSAMLLSDSEVANNTAILNGGGVLLRTGASLNVTRGNISGNGADGSGGGVYMESSSSLRLESSVVGLNTGTNGGGVYVTEQSMAEITTCSMVSNSAREKGGGLYAVDSTNVTVEESSVYSNSAVEAGGGMYGTRITLQTSAFEQNMANNGGGLYGPSGALLRAIGASSIYNNTATTDGGGVYLQQNASLELLPSSLVSWNEAQNNGGGVYARKYARVTADGAGMWRNTADKGGAMYMDEASQLVVDSTSLEMNSCANDGGGIFLAQMSGLDVRASTLVGNKAGGSGGAIFIFETANLASLEDTTFKANVARQGNGGAVVLGRPLAEPALSLERLHFEGNSAMAGSNLFWVYSEDHFTVEPLCRACERADSDEGELIASSAMAGAFARWSPSEERVLPPWITSVALEPYAKDDLLGEYVYIVTDYYGQLAYMGQGSCELTVAAIPGEGISAKGGVIQRFLGDHALFSDLSVLGHPGATTQLQFCPSTGNYSVMIEVSFAQCQRGDQLSRDGMSCLQCGNGTISFSTDFNTSQCVSCDGVDGLQCHGGSVFSVDDGYWVSEQAAEAGTDICSTDPQDDACFFKYIYPCDLCGSGHESGTVLCGSCQEGYEHVMSECFRCPEDAVASWVQAAMMLLVLPLMALLLFTFFRHFGKVAVVMGGDIKRLFVQASSTMKLFEPQLEFISQSLAIFLRYLQTLVPILQLFSDSVTGPLRDALHYLGFIGLPIGAIISGKCLAYNLGIRSPGEFYSEFIFKVSLPVAILLSLGGLMQYYGTRAEQMRARNDEKGVQAVNAVKLNLVTVAVFLLQFIYPSVCIICFGVFRCDEILRDGDLGERSYFLRFDRTVECFKGNWWIVMGCSVVTIIYFIVGGPIVQFLALRYFHSQKKYEVVCTFDSVCSLSPIDSQHVEPMAALTMSPMESQEIPKKKLDGVKPTTPGNKTGEFIFSSTDLVTEGALSPLSDGLSYSVMEKDGVQLAVRPVTTVIKQDDGSELQYHQSRLDEPNSFQRLYVPFERRYYFWGSVILLRLFLSTGCVFLVQQGNEDYAIPYALGVSIFFWGASGQFAAYKNPWCDRVDYVCQSSLMITVFFISIQQAH